MDEHWGLVGVLARLLHKHGTKRIDLGSRIVKLIVASE